MEFLFDTSKLEQVKIHDMDWGSLSGTISSDGHTMTITPYWHDCGQTGERIECSCGFSSEEFAGGGCYSHQGEQKHTFDAMHQAMYDAAQVWHSWQPHIKDPQPDPNPTPEMSNEKLVEALLNATRDCQALWDDEYRDHDSRTTELENEIIPDLTAKVLARMNKA